MRKSANPAVRRRELMLAERNRSAVLRKVYPHLGHLRIELIFNDSSDHPPSPQQHTLYPAAPAFFRFPCPCADCDADFDLMPVVAKLLDRVPGRDRATVSGQMPCGGVRLRDRISSKTCSMQLRFQLVAAASPCRE
jgi:hypothetical protein